MRSLILSLTLLLPLLVGAQGFGSFSHDQPFLAADVVSGGQNPPPFYSALAFWYHAGDLTDSSPTEWPDHVFSGQRWITSVAGAPSLGTNGSGHVYVTFSGTQTMTNEVAFPMPDSTCVFCVIVAFDGGPANQSYLMGQTGIVNNYWYWTTAPVPTWRLNATTTYTYGSAVSNDGRLIDYFDVWTDHLAIRTWYTNNIQSFASAGNVFNPESTTYMIGSRAQPTSSFVFVGQVYDIMMWTNVASSSAVRDAAHDWATNTYGFSP